MKYLNFLKLSGLFLMILLVGCEPLEEVTSNIIIDAIDNTLQPTPTQQPIVNGDDTISIASFNIQILGKTKVSKAIVEEYLPQIIRQYDIVAIQELRDVSDETINTLKRWLPEYQFVVSERLGRSTSKEQYIIAYREGKVLSTGIYDDVNDIFEREPQITYMSIQGKDFTIINNHIKPDAAEQEIRDLDYVIDYALTIDPDFILVGDLNADCGYYNEDLNYLKEYNWAIGNELDTNVAASECTYDRIILNMNYVNSGVDDYGFTFGLTPQQQSVISDHRPVWVTLDG